MTDFPVTKARFILPEGLVYLNGNSLGPLPRAAVDRVGRVVVDEWGQLLIRGWNKAGWMGQSTRLGDRIGELIGAAKGAVIVGDTLTIKVYQALSAALEMRPERRVILSDNGNFPTDLYMAQGLIGTLGDGYELKVVDPCDVADALDETIAVMMLTEVDYATGRKHDMAALTALAHDVGALALWDLAHSAGAVPIDLTAAGADFAVGCTYKYLNAGPGAPAFVYVAPHLQDDVRPTLSGWLGHAAPFAFDLDYRPDAGINRMRIGTPPVIAMGALEAALDIWEGVDMAKVRAKSIELSEMFITEVETRCPSVTIASPRDPLCRGAHIALRHPEGYAIMQALIAHNVIGDFRAPDIMRFGFTPLYLDENDVEKAVDTLAKILNERLWDTPEFRVKTGVT
ncbi:MAG: kynureninase [Paracoccaceae bacterium]